MFPPNNCSFAVKVNYVINPTLLRKMNISNDYSLVSSPPPHPLSDMPPPGLAMDVLPVWLHRLHVGDCVALLLQGHQGGR